MNYAAVFQSVTVECSWGITLRGATLYFAAMARTWAQGLS